MGIWYKICDYGNIKCIIKIRRIFIKWKSKLSVVEACEPLTKICTALIVIASGIYQKQFENSFVDSADVKENNRPGKATVKGGKLIKDYELRQSDNKEINYSEHFAG